jgi:protein-L-isoaspartate O-methyltransferase
MRHATLAIATVAFLTVGIAAAAAQAVTTRIETRPYYGATITIEQGVRVWRPLPPHDRVIINPGAKASVNFDIKSRDRSSNGHHNGDNTHNDD